MRTAIHQQLELLTEQLGDMCAMAAEAIKHATEALLGADLTLAERVIAAQEGMAALSARIEGTAFALLVLQAPVATDLRAVVSAIRVAADAERMGELGNPSCRPENSCLAKRRGPAPASAWSMTCLLTRPPTAAAVRAVTVSPGFQVWPAPGLATRR